jgi:hypothetical protein
MGHRATPPAHASATAPRPPAPAWRPAEPSPPTDPNHATRAQGVAPFHGPREAGDASAAIATSGSVQASAPQRPSARRASVRRQRPVSNRPKSNGPSGVVGGVEEALELPVHVVGSGRGRGPCCVEPSQRLQTGQRGSGPDFDSFFGREPAEHSRHRGYMPMSRASRSRMLGGRTWVTNGASERAGEKVKRVMVMRGARAALGPADFGRVSTPTTAPLTTADGCSARCLR